jgi:hypothetical protein
VAASRLHLQPAVSPVTSAPLFLSYLLVGRKFRKIDPQGGIHVGNGNQANMNPTTKAKFEKAAAAIAKSRAAIKKMQSEISAFDKKVEAIETALQ